MCLAFLDYVDGGMLIDAEAGHAHRMHFQKGGEIANSPGGLDLDRVAHKTGNQGHHFHGGAAGGSNPYRF